MQNDTGKFVDLYVPRKCSATNRILGPKDHASVQINVGHIDETGRYTGNSSPFALSGYIRLKGEGDYHLTRLTKAASL
ncbi:hypothetical protein GEMRC1_012423 [Eukaryota sp. GEM-RC1]